jgi:hypothetical protein
MRRVAFVIGALLLLIIGGGLTAQIAQQGERDAIPVFVVQTENPDASVFEARPWKAEQLVLLVGFLLFNLIGIGVTLALVMWFLSRQVKSVKGGETPPSRSRTETEAAESA